MTTNYPGALDTTANLKNDADDPTISSITHPTAHNNIGDTIIAIETELGVNPSGGDATVVARLGGLVSKVPAANQIVQPTAGTVIPLILRASASHSAAQIMEIQASNGSTLGYWNHLGYLSAASFKINGAALASTHLANTASILRNPSPSITSPAISTPTLTGVPTAPTAAVDTNTTQVATTAFVKNQGYIPLDSPTLTGTPTSPTPTIGDNTTKIATTAFVIAQIAAQSVSTEPVGAIVVYGGASPPAGWLACDGAAVNRTTYADLFAVTSTSYGVGDGSTTFNLPDMRGRSGVGLGTHVDVDARGDSEGQATVGLRRHTHAHSHSLSTGSGSHFHSYASTADGSHSHSLTGSTGTTGGGSIPNAGTATFTSTSTSAAGDHSHTVSINGNGSHGHNISGTVGVSGMTDTPAFLVVNYIIKAVAS